MKTVKYEKEIISPNPFWNVNDRVLKKPIFTVFSTNYV